MSVSPTSTSGSYPPPPSLDQLAFNPNSPVPPYSQMPSKDETSLSNQPPGALPPYAAPSDPLAGPLPPGAMNPMGAPPKSGSGIGGLILAAVAGIPGYFAGKNLWKSHPVAGGIIGSLVTAIAGFVAWGLLSPK